MDRDSATAQWKAELAAMVQRRDDRIAELEDQLEEMRHELEWLRDWKAEAERELEQGRHGAMLL